MKLICSYSELQQKISEEIINSPPNVPESPAWRPAGLETGSSIEPALVEEPDLSPRTD